MIFGIICGSKLTLIGGGCGQNGGMFLFHLFHTILDLIYHLPNLFHLSNLKKMRIKLNLLSPAV